MFPRDLLIRPGHALTDREVICTPFHPFPPSIDEGDSIPLTSTNGAGGDTLLWNARDVGLSCHVTMHRIVLIDEWDAIAIIGGSILLALVQSPRPVGGPFSSYKIELLTYMSGELMKLTIVFESRQHRDNVMAAIKSMNRKTWNKREWNVKMKAMLPSNQVDGSLAGLDAIQKEWNFSVSSHRVLECLFLQWENMHYFALRSRQSCSFSQSGIQDKNESRCKHLDVSMLKNMGITSTLSKKQAGSTCHKQLAQQLVDFLRHGDKLTKASGTMMTLTDIYCLFNRARGTNMIAREDLLKAVDFTKEMNLGISKRLFSSGFMVIQADEFDDNTMGKKLAELASISMEPRQSRNAPSS